MRGQGIVNLSNAECTDRLRRSLSSDADGDGSSPRAHRRSPEDSVRRCRDLVTLDVERVVDGCVRREESLGGASALEAPHLALPSSDRLMWGIN